MTGEPEDRDSGDEHASHGETGEADADSITDRTEEELLEEHPMASEAADSAGVLVENDPLDVVRLITLSRVSYRKMRQNLVWAAGYNVFAIPLAAGVLAPAGILLSPAVGAILMSASTVIVAINAQFLRRADLGPWESPTPPPEASATGAAD